MPVREYFVGLVPLSEIGDILDRHQLERVITDKVNRLHRYCPSLKKLTCSALIYKHQPQIDGTKLRYYLLEKSPNELGMPIIGGFDGHADGDRFAAEVQAVVSDLSHAPVALQIACNPAVDANELHAATTSASEKRALRAAAKIDRGGNVQLPGLERPSTIAIPAVPKFLPLGKAMKISALVVDLPKGLATLTRIRSIDSNGVETYDPEIPTRISLTRHREGPRARFNQLLLEAMDKSIRVTLEVAAVKHWTDASLALFDLVNAQPLYPPHPQG